ncbi:Isochorismatase family [Veillonella rodentium]|uniref:Isochorismatase family n=1 Tax=Veillonella rodentium TaxID=248315 RepID=A0A239ZXF9_9FIRM|nr:Isochorismatase family [Veillonella rodentium]
MCAQKIESFHGPIIFTRDTHDSHYLESQEGQLLPVPHCIKGTDGWHIMEGLIETAESRKIMSPVSFIDKPNFASCCAGVTPESHDAALKTMQACQCIID